MNKIRILIVAVLIVLSVLVFDVFKFLKAEGFFYIDYFNSLFLVPTICIVLLVGAFLYGGKSIFLSNSSVDSKLTQREFEIVQQIIAGKKNHEIADALFVEVSTIKTHINNIYSKLRIKSRDQLIALKRRNV